MKKLKVHYKPSISLITSHHIKIASPIEAIVGMWPYTRNPDLPKADFMNMMIATQRKVAMMELGIGTSVSLGHDNG